MRHNVQVKPLFKCYDRQAEDGASSTRGQAGLHTGNQESNTAALRTQNTNEPRTLRAEGNGGTLQSTSFSGCSLYSCPDFRSAPAAADGERGAGVAHQERGAGASETGGRQTGADRSRGTCRNNGKCVALKTAG